MRFSESARRPMRIILTGLAVTVLQVAASSAQVNPIVFDGNIVWNTDLSVYAGAASAGSPCLPGLDSTTVSIATAQFTRNSQLNPLLSGALNVANPDWRPAPGSPAFCSNGQHQVLQVPASGGFFRQTDYAGALGPFEQDWTAGWTYYGLDGGGRSFPVRPVVVLDNHHLFSNRTFSADSNYLVRGTLRVKNGATLTVQPGVVIFEETASVGTIVVERGARINAVGLPFAPIIITSDAAPGTQTPGGTGGLYLLGRARTNFVNSCAGDSASAEGSGAVGYYGGNDPLDSSGALRYVRVEFAGVTFSPNNEANSFTFCGVGVGTSLQYLQAHRGSDDLFEFFGGNASPSYLVGTYGNDDGFDWQGGYNGRAQFVIIRQITGDAGTERGIEADNNEFDNTSELCSGRSFPTLANFTLIGDRSAGAGIGDGIHLRRGTGAIIINSIVTEWKQSALEINGAATFANHCSDRAGIAAITPPTFCSSSLDPGPVVFDGNLLFGNAGGDYGGAASAGSPCVPGLDSTTAAIATAQYSNNSNADPLLTGALNVAAPNWVPALGSPAYAGNPGHGRTVQTPKDGFFEKACFTGAVGQDDDWTQGWTYYGLDGGGRTFPVRPVTVLDNHRFYSDRTLSADSNYVVRGTVRVKDQATLHIPAGVVLFQETASVGTLVIERGGRISALGTREQPIIITSDAAPGTQTPGGTGGLYILGRARTNFVNSCAGDSASSEGSGTVGFYGGNDDADSSGVMRYVRVEFAGVTFSPNNEANAFTLCGVGSRTVTEYIQAHRGSDDLFEVFGGTATLKRAVLTYGNDDGFDWQGGYRGRAQFVIVRQIVGDAGTERGIEADNNEFANATELCSGRSNPTLSNFTILGDLSTGAGVGDGIHLRRGTAGTILNSIIAYWKQNGLEINGAESFRNHCEDRALAYGPGIQCSAFTTDAPAAGFRTLAAFASPNPVRRDLQIRFTLPAAGHVDVELFGADGRLVRTLEQGTLGAGAHTVQWDTNGLLPAGTYFYRVRANGQQVSGKFVRVQ